MSESVASYALALRSIGPQGVRFENEVSADASVARSVFLAAAFTLVCFGIVAIHTSSITTRQEGFEPVYLSKHLAHLAVAGCVFLWAGSRSATFWRFAVWPTGLTVLAALTIVMVPGVGLSSGGATRWLRLPGFSVQPSEWAKIAIPLLIVWSVATGDRAKQFVQTTNDRRAKRRRLRYRCKQIAALLAVCGCVALTLKQPDLGTSLILVTSAGVACWFAGVRLRWFLIGGVSIAPVAALLSLRGYQIRRITGLIETWHDWQAAPYQLKQSLIALGEGGLVGVGLGRGWQKLSFLPESHTDFVVAVVGEEMGFVGVLFLGCLWIVLLLSGFSMLQSCEDRFLKAVCSTLLTMLVCQAWLNVAVVSAVVPPTGIPHPLLSYGGNSLLVSAVGIGLIWSAAGGDAQKTRTSRKTQSDTGPEIAHGMEVAA